MKKPIWLGSNEMIITLRHVYRRAASRMLSQALEQMSARYANLRAASQTLQILWVPLQGSAALLPHQLIPITNMDQSMAERV